jgi:crotonobetainyl-CoA:carnitine CoA-transferase CaiB-like acyl-CoA transferase
MPRPGNFEYAVFPYTYVRCKDGYAFIAGFTNPNWAALCEILNRSDLKEMFPTVIDRTTPENQPKINEEIEKVTVNLTAAELLQRTIEYSRRPDKKGTVVTARVNSPKEVLDVEHHQVKKMFVKIHDKNYGELLLPNSLFRFMSETPGRIKWACRPIGADNEYIYAKYLGIFKDELESLKNKGVI